MYIAMAEVLQKAKVNKLTISIYKNKKIKNFIEEVRKLFSGAINHYPPENVSSCPQMIHKNELIEEHKRCELQEKKCIF